MASNTKVPAKSARLPARFYVAELFEIGSGPEYVGVINIMVAIDVIMAS